MLLLASRSVKPIPKIEVYKVSIAPLPQPKILSIEEPVPEEEIEKEKKKEIPKEKAPPKEKTSVVKTEKKKPEKSEKIIKKGLPDIKPKIYTGSGRGFTYSYYLNILLNKINKNWHNPYKGKDVVLKSMVYFEVDKEGKIYNVRLEESSGDNMYNETTIRAVTLAKKLPPLPKEFADDYLKVHLEFLTAQ
ncbi:MAG: TonB family protein [bacterium]